MHGMGQAWPYQEGRKHSISHRGNKKHPSSSVFTLQPSALVYLLDHINVIHHTFSVANVNSLSRTATVVDLLKF